MIASRIRRSALAATLALAAVACTAGPVTAFAAGDTITTASGLKIVVTNHGNGARPRAGEVAIVHYTGTLTDGTEFDDSRKRGEPFAFTLGRKQVIRGWDEGIALLHVGDRARLIIPSELGYGERGAAGGKIPPNATLIFDVELVNIAKKTVGTELAARMQKRGPAAGKALYEQLKRSGFKGYYMSEAELNGVGYSFLKANKLPEAIAMFEINVDAFPKSANVYDSLGEACMNAGRKNEAIGDRWNWMQPNRTRPIC